MPIPQPPPLRPPRPLHRWRLAGIVIGACVLATVLLVAAFYLEEDWRGARTWDSCQRELAARGETLDWRAFIPPPVPDDQNLAMAPLFVRFLHYRTDPKTGALTFSHDLENSDDFKAQKSLDGTRPPGILPGRWDLARHTDLAAYQRYYRGKAELPHSDQPQTPAEDVLLALSRDKPVLDELAQAAARRPLSRFPVAWDAANPFMTALPHYNLEQFLAGILSFRASAHLAAGHPEDALSNLELCWRFCGDMSRDHILISHLVQITCLGVTLTPVWEGLADRRWNAAKLAGLQTDLQRFDLLAIYAATVRGERAGGLRGLDFEESHRDLSALKGIILSSSDNLPETPLGERVAYWATPKGWFDRDKAILARNTQEYVIDAIDPKAHRIFPERLEAGLRARSSLPIWYTEVMLRQMLEIFDGITLRTARLQTGLDEAVTACALERFFLDHQAYPGRLDELVPDYLEHVPTDVIDGSSLRYHPTPDGRYQLYGVGWNKRDDGGQVAWTESKSLDIEKGDWVWQYTELNPPAPAPKK